MVTKENCEEFEVYIDEKLVTAKSVEVPSDEDPFWEIELVTGQVILTTRPVTVIFKEKQAAKPSGRTVIEMHGRKENSDQTGGEE